MLLTPPDYVLQTLHCTSIQYPDVFLEKLGTDSVETQLVTNLRQFGQVSPLLVWEKQHDTFQLLADYTCFRAMLLLGCEHATCRVLPCTIAPYQRYGVQVLHGWNELQASPIFQAYLLQNAQRDLGQAELLSILALMGHKPHQHVADELIALLTLSDTALLAVHHGILGTKSAKLMQRLSQQDQESVVELVQKYRLGGSKQYKLVEMLTELVARWNTSVVSILDKLVFTGQVTEGDNGPQQMQSLMRGLSALCFPEKTRLDRQFHQFVSSLSLPKNVSIAPSTSFEDDHLTLCLHCSNDQELQRKWARIKVLLQNDQKGRSDTL